MSDKKSKKRTTEVLGEAVHRTDLLLALVNDINAKSVSGGEDLGPNVHRAVMQHIGAELAFIRDALRIGADRAIEPLPAVTIQPGVGVVNLASVRMEPVAGEGGDDGKTVLPR